ncbi:MAG TPA: hypothetical protein PLW14_11475 [Chlorobiota bacterium]|nr:hypothetical protein [Chlorobiota bacterium]
MLRRSLTIILTLTLLGQQVGVLVVMKGLQYTAQREARRTIRAGVPVAELSRLVLRDSQPLNGRALRWIHDGEFVMDGRYYDVVRKRDSADVTIVLAFIDDEETWVAHALHSEVQRALQRQTQSGPLRTCLEKLLTLSAILPKKIDVRMDVPHILHRPCEPPLALHQGHNRLPEIPPKLG